MSTKDFSGKRPQFLPETFFPGRLEGWGIIEGPMGGLQKRFTIEAAGEWKEAARVVRFIETWKFDDGFSDTLDWQISKKASGRYVGAEKHLVSEAKGQQSGFAFRWRYARNTPQKGGSSLRLSFDDWFYKIDENVVCVRGRASRFGLPLLYAFVTYRKISSV
ncbi:hypothetical protein GJW-30_1_04417 [Variibacter gotjawalensis]|uniref:DUF3833 domain-containing protein n=1 Tax=Variibacter gotjawalensis TaxID=1333996 RepID=A0A0S3Q100_9BRAD|nr:DUF3833 family protein [Variibacter gotjawalensis]NIK47698.1 hypothetical protein [Variibacter gotjawalensis]RZS49592.1 uncharacterized protein DUF3833 [Variibacter gotjawalensis]BAT61855.1 hypothetical protein GJW-30_1_04417 [Variibacter gotjawalensis]